MDFTTCYNIKCASCNHFKVITEVNEISSLVNLIDGKYQVRKRQTFKSTKIWMKFKIDIKFEKDE